MVVEEGDRKLKAIQVGKTEKDKIEEQNVETGHLLNKISTSAGQSGSSIILE